MSKNILLFLILKLVYLSFELTRFINNYSRLALKIKAYSEFIRAIINAILTQNLIINSEIFFPDKNSANLTFKR